ncbi:putative epoxide hydrolase [Diplonema papillatum]|nr:putative epoxide hydrolase [Diplonema papillatum]|eukprot:gene16489-25284_t
MASEEIRPFRVEVPEAVLEDLQRRLAAARLPDTLEPGDGWVDGTNRAYLDGLVRYWRESFDWRAAERRLNGLPQFVTEVRGIDLHFYHVRSRHANAQPLLLLHGWPGSIVEFLDVIPRLTDPESHGGKASDAFHVVCPSLPGYGFSSPAREHGMDIRKMGQVFSKLMARLEYKSYIAQGGDWGSMISTWMAVDDAACRAVHINMVIGMAPSHAVKALQGILIMAPVVNRLFYTPEEIDRYETAMQFLKSGTGYQAIQGTKPQTLGASLNDSPVGLAAWIIEKFHAWGDIRAGDVESRFSKDTLLTNIMIYWVTQTITSSCRLYMETRRSHRLGPVPHYVAKPTACLHAPKEIFTTPRSWANRNYNVVQWSTAPKGGHFFALEEPEYFVTDLRRFLDRLRSAKL